LWGHGTAKKILIETQFAGTLNEFAATKNKTNAQRFSPQNQSETRHQTPLLRPRVYANQRQNRSVANRCNALTSFSGAKSLSQLDFGNRSGWLQPASASMKCA